MYKKTLILILIFNSLLLNAESIFDDQPGSYVIYSDERFNDQAYIGLLYLGDDSLLIRTFEKNNNLELALILKLKIADEEIGFDESMQILTGSLKDSQTTQRIMPMILNWGNAWLNSKEKIQENKVYSERYVDLYSYQFWIPIFNIESIEDDPNFKIETVGTVQDINDPAFAQFTGIPESINSDSFKIFVKNSEKTYIPSLGMSLDNNWVEGDDGIFRIQMKTVQDAALFVESFSIEGTPFKDGYDIAKYFMLANSGGIVLANVSKIFSLNNDIIFENRVLDPRTGAISIQKKKIKQDENIISITTLASFLDLYNENSSYFDSLFE